MDRDIFDRGIFYKGLFLEKQLITIFTLQRSVDACNKTIHHVCPCQRCCLAPRTDTPDANANDED